ncbi:hypothetical protein AB3N04_00885 (plasmid) [Alkalihalophilus sp. As8PL]|uniref:Uncharacterized protein n=1 Tax=Alkalihalophilus sp. As8PL TaxID=3237103 RepID=A0AB39BMC4_9BACI
MNQKEFLDVITELGSLMGRAGGDFCFREKEFLITYKGNSLRLFTKPNTRLNPSIDPTNVWDYGTYSLNYSKVEALSVINLVKIEQLLTFVESLIQVLVQTEVDASIESEFIKRYKLFNAEPTKTNYLLYKSAGELYLTDEQYYVNRRKRQNKSQKAIIDRFVEIKIQLLIHVTEKKKVERIENCDSGLSRIDTQKADKQTRSLVSVS